MISLWAELTYKQIAELGNRNAWALLPIGSIEQHGPHLPVGTDSLLLKEILRLALEKYKPGFPVVVLPILEFGKSIEHRDYPGTVSFSTRTMLAILDDFASSLTSANIKRLAIINSHGGNTALINGYLLDLRSNYNIEVIAIHLSTIYRNVEREFKDMIGDFFHACGLETSLALSLFPEFVNMSEVPTAHDDDPSKFHRLISLRDKVSMGWSAREISSSGAIGQPWLANAEVGEKLADKITSALVDVFIEAMGV